MMAKYNNASVLRPQVMSLLCNIAPKQEIGPVMYFFHARACTKMLEHTSPGGLARKNRIFIGRNDVVTKPKNDRCQKSTPGPFLFEQNFNLIKSIQINSNQFK